MNRKKEKRFLSLLLMLCIVLSILPASAVAASVCPHGHESCGYQAAAEGQPCQVEAAHVHDAACGYAEATADKAETPCAFVHVHDEGCGYAEAKAGAVCTEECAACSAESVPANLAPEEASTAVSILLRKNAQPLPTEPLTETTISEGAALYLRATLTPADSTETISFTSSNPEVVYINGVSDGRDTNPAGGPPIVNGKVATLTGRSAGSSVITATAGGASASCTVTVTAVPYTAGLTLWPSNGLSIDAVKAALTAKGIAFKETVIPGLGSYVKLSTVQQVSAEAFQNNANIRAMNNVAAAALINGLFFGGEAFIAPTSLTGYSCNNNGKAQNITANICDAPGTTIEPDKTKPVKLTLVNQNGDGSEQVIEGQYFVNSTINPLQDFVSADPDDPVTAWCTASRDKDGTLTVSKIAITGAYRLTGDLIIAAVHNAPKNYVRMVMIGYNDPNTDLINTQKINENTNGVYTPQPIPGTRNSLDKTVTVTLTQYKVLSQQYRGTLPGEENTKYLRELLIANGLMTSADSVYSAHPVEYWHTANNDKKTINVSTFIVSLASLHNVSYAAADTEGRPLAGAALPQALSGVPFATGLFSLVDGKEAALAGYEFQRWEYEGKTLDQASGQSMPAGDVVLTAVLKELTGELTVSNTVTGNAADKTKKFTFTLTLDAEGSYSYTGSSAGTIKSGDKFELAHGESITVQGLPVGTGYTVTEADYGREGYTSSSSGAAGKIVEGTVTAAFTNSRTSAGGPKTGDGSGYPIWLVILAVSGAGWLGSSRLRRRYGDKA